MFDAGRIQGLIDGLSDMRTPILGPAEVLAARAFNGVVNRPGESGDSPDIPGGSDPGPGQLSPVASLRRNSYYLVYQLVEVPKAFLPH